MNYYLLPGTGIFGGVKVGYQFAELLNELGSPCVVATPDGRAPSWFASSVPTIGQEDLAGRVTTGDVVLFSLPHDHARVAGLPGRKVFHCQGTDPRIDYVLRDERITVLTCWPQAMEYARKIAGREPAEVGIHVADAFFHAGDVKQAGTVAFMPRRGADIAEACRAVNPHLRFIPIEGATEAATARILRTSEIFLATAEHEWFGLPALEAMAAGCVVVSVPTVGGTYLRHESNALVAARGDLPACLARIAAPSAVAGRAALRDRARVTASEFRRGRQLKRIAQHLEGALSFLRP